VDAVRVDVDRLVEYSEELDRRTAETQAVLRSLTGPELDPGAFGELGRSLGTPQAYQRAADRLRGELERAHRVLGSVATALRGAAEHYRGEDTGAARTLEQRAATD